MNEQLTTQSESAFSLQNFEHAQRVAKMIAASSLVPQAYQGKVENVMIAMEMSNRMGISPLMVMQNLHIVKGNPGWSGSFVIAMVNGSKRFDDNLEFEFSGTADEYGCIAFTSRKGKRVESTKVDWKMVKGEGWLNKEGSKWKTMPDQMFRYRSAAFFGRAHTPDLLMGMQTADEIMDVDAVVVRQSKNDNLNAEALQTLLDEKVALLTKKEFESAKRIIDNKEVDSYPKLFTLLTEKTE